MDKKPNCRYDSRSYCLTTDYNVGLSAILSIVAK